MTFYVFVIALIYSMARLHPLSLSPPPLLLPRSRRSRRQTQYGFQFFYSDFRFDELDDDVRTHAVGLLFLILYRDPSGGYIDRAR